MEDELREILNIQVAEYQHLDDLRGKMIRICNSDKLRLKLEEAKLPLSPYDLAVASNALSKAQTAVSEAIDKTIQRIFDLFSEEESLGDE